MRSARGSANGPGGPAWLSGAIGVGAAATLLAVWSMVVLAGRDQAKPPADAPDRRQPAAAASSSRPNIIYILADDLGYGEIGPYGQRKIETPRLDRFAAEGLRFTQFYAGSPVCAPSRGAFLTGRHTGHAYVRDNHELGGFADAEERGQEPLPVGTRTIARWLQTQGYATAAIGKWGLGGPGSIGAPNKHGFDLFFGYLDQKQAHNCYPSHLWKNDARFPLRNPYFSPHQKLAGDPADPAAYRAYLGTDYAIDRMTQEAVAFLEAHAKTGAAGRAQPFFLYFAPTLPHLALQVPEAARARYDGRFPETPYTGDHGYLPQRTPRAAYAAMITTLDTQVGILLDTLRAQGLDQNTIVFFTSDNGASFATGGIDTAFFDSNGGLRGAKATVYEGGVRVPMIARWPGRIAAGGTTDHVAASWDVWTTVADLIGRSSDGGRTDGLSFAPALLGTGAQPRHDFLYWEFSSQEDGSRAVRMGRWKGVRRHVRTTPDAAMELYDLDRDVAEAHDLSAAHPDIVARIDAIMRREHTPAPLKAWEF
jgi:arylsulfatase A-like enzyme